MLGGSSTKTIGIDDFFEHLQSQRTGVNEREQFAQVAWIFRGVNIRASKLSRIPYHILDGASEEVDVPIDLSKLLFAAEADLVLSGAAYWLKKETSLSLNGVQRLNPWAVKVEADSSGVHSFEQRTNGRRRTFDPEQIVYFDHLYNPYDDLGPGVAPAQVAGVPSSLVQNMNLWASKFFEQGAIPAVVLRTEGVIGAEEQERIRTMWQKIVAGVERAWRVMTLQRGMQVERVGMPVSDLAMPDLDQRAKEQIAAALGIPMGMLVKGQINRATAQAHQESLLTDTIIPEATLMQTSINEQLFGPLGLTMEFDFGALEVIQRMEAEKANSVASLMREINASVMTGVLPILEARALFSRLLQQMELPALDDLDMSPEQPELPDGEMGAMKAAFDKEHAKDLDTWQRIAVRELEDGNEPADYDFESDYIPDDERLAIRNALRIADSASEVERAFDIKGSQGAKDRKRQLQEAGLRRDLLDYYSWLSKEVVERIDEAGIEPGGNGA